jgi:hypothetical protein
MPSCAFRHQDLGPCGGRVRAYYLDPETRVEVCDAHLLAAERLAEAAADRVAAGDMPRTAP